MSQVHEHYRRHNMIACLILTIPCQSFECPGLNHYKLIFPYEELEITVGLRAECGP